MAEKNDNPVKGEFLSTLLQKYFAGQCTPEEEQWLDYWYVRLDEEPKEHLPENEWQALEKKLWRNIKQRAVIEPAKPAMPSRFRLSPAVLGLAASLALLLGWFGFNYRPFSKDSLRMLLGTAGHSRLAEVVNTTQQPLRFDLHDGSSVTLMPRSRVKYPENRAAKVREVFLVGEAFFKVKKDLERPFLVHAGAVVTKVLGTSFTVKMPAGEKGPVEVVVKTGRVAVAAETEVTKDARPENAKEVILTPNQQVVYNAVKQNFKVGLVAEPVLLEEFINGKETFIYKDTPLQEVAYSLEKMYGVTILVAPDLRRCPLTANLTQEDFYTKISLICQALQAEYEQKGTQISISGKGCENK